MTPKIPLAKNILKSITGGTFIHKSLRYTGGQSVQNFYTDNYSGQFRLVAPLNTSQPLETRYDVNGNALVLDNNYQIVGVNWDDPNVTNPTNDWGTNSQDATTAQWAVYKAYEYFNNNFLLNGLDNYGSLPRVTINAGNFYDNAFFAYYQPYNYLTFGRSSTYPYYSLAKLDIVGHEYGHGVSKFLVNNVGLINSQEARALNEGFSDIIGFMTEKWSVSAWNWTVGEDMEDNGFVRNISNPAMSGTPQPETYQGSHWDFRANPDPHINAGVLSKWFSIMSQNQGPAGVIGPEPTMQIVYRALDVYLQPSSNYADARDATLFASRDVFGNCSSQETALIQAWGVVNLPIYNYYCEPTCNYSAGAIQIVAMLPLRS